MDSLLSLTEIQFMVKCLLKKSLTKKEVKEIIKLEDRDLDTKLNFYEFINLVK